MRAIRRAPTLTALGILLALTVMLSLIGAAPAQTIVDYDADDDGYIDVATHVQLNAIRHDLDGNGDATHADYAAAFPNRDTNAATRMGCPDGTCVGYELTANIDLDTDGDGSHGSGDAYYDSGSGWDPIGGTQDAAGHRYTGDFKGNRFTIDNLTINRSSANYVGLFALTASTSRIESVGLTNANVSASTYVGILVGGARSSAIVACYSTGSVTAATVTVGGLVGWTNGSITTSYSTASVSGTEHVGGLLGANQGGAVTNSYATGAVTRSSGANTTVGGLIGSGSASNATASYYDTTTSGCVSGGSNGCTTSAGGTGRTTTQLQSPTGYTGIYADWNIDLDGFAIDVDDPWNFGTSSQYPTLKYGTPGDYDRDGDNYIEIRSLAQLNAVRYDLDGNGAQGTTSASDWTNYTDAFPNAISGMGCASTCTGYELHAFLDFDSDSDGDVDANDHGGAYWDSGAGWTPIGASGASYSGDFKGNGFTINNLFISRGTAGAYQGLFGIIGSTARVETLGVTNANVAGDDQVAILAGGNTGEIVACYTTGSVTGNLSVGGITGLMQGASASVLSSYSTASVAGTGTGTNRIGGLIGRLHSGDVTHSYSTGAVSGAGTPTNIGGLIGEAITATGISASYWDTQTSGQAASAGGSAVLGKTTSELQTPTAYTGIYAAWNANIDGAAGNDDPWDFGTASEYPALKYGGHSVFDQGRGDYDADNDGYIDVANLAQLDAMRRDLNGDGNPETGGATGITAYDNAFVDRAARAAIRMGCPRGACVGYELTANLDFDTNGDGSVTVTGDTYWNGGEGWIPIGVEASVQRFQTTFKGNGHTINNLFINRPGSTSYDQGLFGVVHTNGRIESLGVTNANVTGGRFVAILAGAIYGDVVACYTTGSVTATNTDLPRQGVVGGLVGWAGNANFAKTAIISSSYSTASVNGYGRAGGLVGNAGKVNITNSYATGRVTLTGGTATTIGGLIGYLTNPNVASVTASYWDTVSNGQSPRSISSDIGATSIISDLVAYQGEAKTPRELQTVTGYSGIYADWNANLDGEAGNDDPWHFGNGMQYPMLKYQGMPTAPQGGLAMGIPDNWNAPVAGERLAVCLVDGPSMRGVVSGQTYLEAWGWERSPNGAAWTPISGAGDGNSPPTYEYSPTATDVGNFIRAKVKLTDGSFAYTRALGGRVVAASASTAGAEIPFVRGHAAPQVGAEIVVSNPLPARAVDGRVGWQRCPNNTAPHSDCTYIAGYPVGHWWTRYTPTTADVGSYLRMYAYYETADGTWTRRVTPFTTAVVAAR